MAIASAGQTGRKLREIRQCIEDSLSNGCRSLSAEVGALAGVIHSLRSPPVAFPSCRRQTLPPLLLLISEENERSRHDLGQTWALCIGRSRVAGFLRHRAGISCARG